MVIKFHLAATVVLELSKYLGSKLSAMSSMDIKGFQGKEGDPFSDRFSADCVCWGGCCGQGAKLV